MTKLIIGRAVRAPIIAAVWIGLWAPGISYGQSPAQEGKIYWTGLERGIHRSGLDGKNAEQLVKPEWSYPGDIALDGPGNKMYWTDRRTGGWHGTIGSIYRSTIDRTDIEILLVDNWIETPLGDKSIDLGEGWAQFNPVELLGYHSWTASIALDSAGGKMYWTEMLSGGDVFTGGLLRANLDGSNAEYVSLGGFPGAIALDLVGDKVYWEDYDKIHRADLNGENPEYDLIRLGSGYIVDLALDVEGGKVYWTNPETKTIQRADLDGQNIEEVLPVPDGYPEKIVIDVDGGGIFWTNPGTMTIHRADFDGENVQHLLDLEKDVKRNLFGPRTSIALDVGRKKIYWTDSGPGKIKRANLNGQNLEILFDPVVREPYDILLYMDKMYWTDAIKGTIQRADLNGGNLEVLISGLNRPEGIAMLEGNKIYWTEGGPGEFGWIPEQGKIQAADLDGTNVQEIVTGLSHSGDIALDAVRGMIYWVDFDRTENRNILQRADLDGSNVETVPGLADDADTPGDHMYVDTRVTVLYILHDKIYWMSDKVIQRGDLNGSNVEDISILPEDRYVYHTAFDLDSIGSKAYWSTLVRDQYGEVWAEEIFRSNLDGSNVEKIGKAPSGSWGNIALDIPVPTAVSMQNTSPAVPVTSLLEQNVPNPFNSNTRIPYHLATSGQVRLEIFNTLGQRVRTLVNEVQPAGFYQVPWDARYQNGSAVAAGIYLGRLHYPGGVQTRRLLFLK